MPLYTYACQCGAVRDIFKPIRSLDQLEFCLTCAQAMERRLSAPRIVSDYEPYNCPITGKVIAGRKAHRENLAEHGCRVLEPGELESAKRRRATAEAELDKSIGDTVEAEIHAMPVAKRDKLVAELQSGVTAEVVRT